MYFVKILLIYCLGHMFILCNCSFGKKQKKINTQQDFLTDRGEHMLCTMHCMHMPTNLCLIGYFQANILTLFLKENCLLPHS